MRLFGYNKHQNRFCSGRSGTSDAPSSQLPHQCRYNWHGAVSLGWTFPMLKSKCIFPIKYTEAILTNITRKLLWFEITKMLIAV